MTTSKSKRGEPGIEGTSGSGASLSPPLVPSASSASLLGESGELKINHNGEWYSLRRTRNGKLILTK